MRLLPLALLLALATTAHAQVEQPDAKTHWVVEWTNEGVPRDGHHLGLTWTRDMGPATTVVIFRRKAQPGTKLASNSIRVVDQKAQIIPAFMYPDTFKTEYQKAIDVSTQPIPAGTQLGVWTVVGSVDGDPAAPFIDRVEPDAVYQYVLVPAKRADKPDTYESLEGPAVITPPLQAAAGDLVHARWFQAVLAAGALVIVAIAAFVVRRRRAGANRPAEAS
ncbi:MAG: hypothetical protein JO257_09915 [Deltaproteobacteria bacterium]|nr:hypothetical protein [Deltaproteobacteria bacterium]